MVEASEKEMEGPNEFDDGVEVQYSPEEAEAVEAGREQEPSASPLQNLTPTTDTHTLRRSIRERRPTHMFTYPKLGQPSFQPHTGINALTVPSAHPMYTPFDLFSQPHQMFTYPIFMP